MVFQVGFKLWVNKKYMEDIVLLTLGIQEIKVMEQVLMKVIGVEWDFGK